LEHLEPVDHDLTSARAARTWQTRRSDGSWPTVARCNDGIDPDWALRHGDVVLHRIDSVDVSSMRSIHGNVLAAGTATGHSHMILGACAQYDAGNGTRILVLESEAQVDHQEHRTTPTPAGTYRVSIKRQYDADNGWVSVED